MPTIAKALENAVALSVGQNVQRYRKKKGWTQLTLAYAIGYTGPDAGSYISRIESGAQSPRIEQARKLAKALGVQIGKLIV